MIELCGEMIVPQFGEYKYINEVSSKPELILFHIGFVIFLQYLRKKLIYLLILKN